MKQIVIVTTKSYLTINNGKDKQRYLDKCINKWRYLKPIQDTTVKITSYKELIEQELFISFPTETKKQKRTLGSYYSTYYNSFDNFNEINFSDKNFILYEINTSYDVINSYTMQDLINNLPADEMIEYLKDNGLNVCPIAR